MVASVRARIELVSGDFVTTTLYYGPMIYTYENSGPVHVVTIVVGVGSGVGRGMLFSVK